MDPEQLERRGGLAAIARGARATLARRHLADFVKQAVAAGEIEGCTSLEWGPHLEAHCFEVQMQLEGWIVANGPGDEDSWQVWEAWETRHAEMIARQRAAWERTGAKWEDRKPQPWLRYVLVQNAIDNLPPGTFKSTIVMVCANAWIWLWAPRFSFAALSGIDANVGRDSRACRRLIRSSWYRETFSIAWTDKDADLELAPEDIGVTRDTDAIDAWQTTVGGKRISRTLTRGLTGAHADGIFLDDPDDADKVHGEAERLRPQQKWTNAAENRVNDEHRSIRRMMQQVVHVEGMTAYLLSIARWSAENPKGWSQLCVPAEYGFGPADAPVETPFGTRDWRSEKGETMHPRLSAGVLADKRLKLPGYEGQYNHNPRRSFGGLFAHKFARFFLLEGMTGAVRRRPEGCAQAAESPPVVVKLSAITGLTLSVDAQNSLNPAPGAKLSAVGLLVAGCIGDDRFVCDDRTRTLGPSGTYLAIYQLIATWPLERILVELKALGAGVIDEITRAVRRGWYIDPDTDARVELLGPDGKRPRCVVEPFQPGKESKEQRWHAMLPTWEQGRIHLLDGAEWLYPVPDADRKILDEGFVGEICSLPHSRRKDRADALAQFIASTRGSQDTRDSWRAMSRLAHAAARRRW